MSIGAWPPNAHAYVALFAAILREVAGTTFLKQSEQSTRPGPTVAMAALSVAAFHLLSRTFDTIPLGIAYAIWGGLGIVLTAIIGVVMFRQTLDAPALLGMGMIVGGVVVMRAFSRSLSD